MYEDRHTAAFQGETAHMNLVRTALLPATWVFITLGAAASRDGERHRAADPKSLPAPYATPSVQNPPRVIPQPEGATLRVPKGFHASIWADGLENPRWLTVAPNGDVFVVESGPNRVTLLRDTNGH